MNHNDRKQLIWLADEIKSPPFFQSVRIEVGFLLEQLQAGEIPSMPMSKPMASIGDRCHELRVNDLKNNKHWRVIYRIDDDAIVILDVFSKVTQKTPEKVIDNCQSRLKRYDRLSAIEPIKRQKLAEAGWKVGSISEFLKLTPEETVTIEIRLSLSKYLESLKQQAAKDLSSDRSRIPKLGSVDPSVSIDLLIRSLLLVGATREGIAAAISGQSLV